tara:strand:- start:1672 stop:2100 length:429 start_codon:yes stop_codon:yes gene_type:complete
MNRSRKILVAAFIGGIIFGIGLTISKMTHPEVVLDFLQLDDLGLLLVMGGGATVAAIGFQIGTRTGKSAPLTGKKYGLREREFDKDVIIGGVIFGIGWGIAGVCPGPAFASLGIGNYAIVWSIAGMILGAHIHGFIRENRSS